MELLGTSREAIAVAEDASTNGLSRMTAIVVTYNSEPYLEGCLTSLLSALEGFDSEVIVVDNASTDRSIELIRARYPGMILISSRQNLGFAKAVNLAARVA